MRPAVALLCLALAAPAGAAESSLAKIPVWKASAGWWQSDNTYLNGAMDYNIRAYNSLVHVELDGNRLRETEYKFYPPSKLALQNGRGQTSAEEGVEVVTETVYEQADAKGTLRLLETRPALPIAEATIIRVLNDDTAERVTPDPKSGVDSYRMFITLPTPSKRYRANFGIVSSEGKCEAAVGDLRGFSLFRETRTDGAAFEKLRAELRAKNNVRAVVTAGPDNKAQVQRLP